MIRIIFCIINVIGFTLLIYYEPEPIMYQMSSYYSPTRINKIKKADTGNCKEKGLRTVI